MQVSRARPQISLQALVIVSLFTQSCGLTPQLASTPCGAKMAQIDVYENFMTRTCGCKEGNGGNFGVGQPLTCTVAQGTTVFFYYPSITGQHLIRVGAGATGTPTYHSPQSGTVAIPSDAVILNSTSTGITFTDQYSTVGGSFVVQ